MHTPASPAVHQRRVRIDSPDRWRQALVRARRGRLQLRQLVGSGAWVATSERDEEAAYMVTEYECDCFAAEFGDPVCKHRAMLRYRMGHLAFDHAAAA
jgi:hypothetical protein